MLGLTGTLCRDFLASVSVGVWSADHDAGLSRLGNTIVILVSSTRDRIVMLVSRPGPSILSRISPLKRQWDPWVGQIWSRHTNTKKRI